MSAERMGARGMRVAAAVIGLAWVALGYKPIVEDLTTTAQLWPVLAAALASGCGAWVLARRAGRGARGEGTAATTGGGGLLARALMAPPRWAFVGLVAVASVAITAWFQYSPMHALLISRDASVYVPQARALSHLSFGIPVAAPRLAYSAHFLFEGADGRLHGVFAPGYPLFLAPFVALGHPLLAGTFTAVLLVLAQLALARRVLRDELAVRASLLLPLPSFARVAETGDLLSHAFVAALAAFAAALALGMHRDEGAGRRPRAWRAALFGACVGWLASARMLDGIVLGVVLGVVVLAAVVRRRVPVRFVAIALAAALPFVGLVAAQQKVASGSFTRATSVEYARRADFPPTCLRLGFGRDVGCVVEHTRERNSFGEDGYTPDDALRLVRDRTGELGNDLFGFAPLVLLAFAALVLVPAPATLLCGVIPLALTLAYGLFYYGNAPVFGARHLYPAAPFVYVAAAAALASLGRLTGAGTRATVVATVTVLAAAIAGGVPHWKKGLRITRRLQERRHDVRAAVAHERVTRGIVVTQDLNSYLAGLDPWGDGPDRMVVIDDRAGMFDLRRYHPDLPMYLFVPNRPERPLFRVEVPPPAPGLRVEFERAWPSFVRVSGLGVASVDTVACCSLATSGDHVLLLFDATPGAELRFPFDLAHEGQYTLRLEGLLADDYGDYELAIDGEPFAVWHGWASRRVVHAGERSAPRWLARGAHTFSARCIGHAPDSRGYLVSFDALIAEPAP